MNEQTKQVRDALLVLMKHAHNKAAIDDATKDIYEHNAKAKHDNPMATHSILSCVAGRLFGASEDCLELAMPELMQY